MSEFVDPLPLLKRLPFDQTGQFEPVSGMMLVNITSAEFAEICDRYQAGQHTAADVDIMRTINHEVYHFAQTVASGYMYQRQHRMFLMIRDAKLPPEPEAGVPPLLSEMTRLSALRERAAPGDHSLAGAILPELFVHERQLAEIESEPNAAGLSIKALVEGSAVVHAELLMGDLAGARARVEAQLVIVPPVYRILFDLTVSRYGDRALELILPATALALRYTRPHDAYFELLAAIAGDPAGDPIARGRALGNDLPTIAEAGPILGTAIDVHEPTAMYSVYAGLLRDLADGKWQVDSYELLADPEAMQRMPGFPLGLATRDGLLGSIDRVELTARLILMSIALKVRSRARDERDFEKAFTNWAQSLLGR